MNFLMANSYLIVGVFVFILAVIIAVCAYLDHGAFQPIRVDNQQSFEDESSTEAK
jgi:hypothetical protein